MPEETVVIAPAEKQLRDLIGDRKSLTMYAAAGILSEVLQRRVREQMLYNYRAKKLIRCNAEGRVTADEFVAFAMKRVLKNQK